MAEPPRSTMDTANASQSNGSTDVPDVVMVDNANHLENDQESSLLTKKRKATDDNAPASASLGANAVSDTADELAVQSKKAKLEAPSILEDISLLPAEVWQHIFSFCPPRTLGNLLMVNKLFNSYLDTASPVVVEKRPPTTAKSAVKYVQPNALWRNARRSFWPNMPAPLKGKFELDMWRLACSSTCQFCGRRDPKRTQSTSDPLRLGPGVDGVSRIWDFRVRCCGTCLSRNTMTEMDLLMSTTPTFLIPALPFVFVTSLSSIVPLHVIQQGQLPPSCTLTKIFWTSDVNSLREEFDSVKELGAPAVEEWQKGLSKRGSSLKADSSKWEKYDESGGVKNMRTLLHPEIKAQASAIPEPHKNTVPSKIAEPSKPTQLPKAAEPSKAVEPPKPIPLVPADKPTAEPNKSEESQKPDAVVVVKPSPPPPGQTKTAEEIDAEWDLIQGPVRLKILRYAEEAIAGDWDDGDKVTRDNAPAFAADVLLHVRKRFYMEVEKEAQAARAAGRQPVVDPADGPFTQKLTLENMKYVFDVKVKPISSKVRAELFACPICDVSAKFFGFEGAIQHYAAKHTNVLSVGNIVVFWRAEWPEDPPFRPNPRVHKITGMPIPLHLPSAPKGPSQRGPGPAAKRAGRDYQSFGPQPPHPQPLPYQQLSTHFPPPLVQAPVSLPPPPPPPPPPPQQQQQFPPMVRPQIHPFPLPGNGGGEPQYNGPSFAQGPQQAHMFGAPSYHHTGQPQNQQAPYQPPPFHSQPHNVAYRHFTEHNGRSGNGFAVPPSIAASAPVQAPPPAAPVPSTPVTSAPVPTQVANPFAASAPYESHIPAAAQPLAEKKGNNDIWAPKSPYQERLDVVVSYAQDLWEGVMSLVNIPFEARVHVLLYHTNKHYWGKFGEELPLALFKDRILRSKGMELLGSARDFYCQACRLGLDDVPGNKGGDTLFKFRELVVHFSQSHVEGRTMRANPFNASASKPLRPIRDWLTEMVVLPPQSEIRNMMQRSKESGMYKLFLEAMQDALARQKKANPAQGRVWLHTSNVDQPRRGRRHRQTGNSTDSAESPKTNERAPPPKAPATGAASQEAGTADPSTSNKQKPQEASGNDNAGARTNEPEVKIKEEEGNEPGKLAVRNAPLREVAASPREDAAPRRKAAAPREEPDLLGALEMHLEGEPARRSSPVARDRVPVARAPTRVVYVDEYGREVVPRYADQRDSYRDPRGRPRDVDPYVDVVDERDERDERYQRRPVSPRGYPGGHGPPSRGPSGHYRERSPLPARRYADEPVYSGHPREYDVVYERGAPPGPPHHYVRAPPRQEYYSDYDDGAHRGERPYRPVDYEPYEPYDVVRVTGPDGEYLVRRPVRREAPPADRRAPEHYYAHEYADEYRQPGYSARYYEPSHASAVPEHERRDAGYERSAASPQQHRSVARSDPAYYQEYDPRNPMNALANNVSGQGQTVMMQGYSLAVSPVIVGDGSSQQPQNNNSSSNDSNLLTSS